MVSPAQLGKPPSRGKRVKPMPLATRAAPCREMLDQLQPPFQVVLTPWAAQKARCWELDGSVAMGASPLSWIVVGWIAPREAQSGPASAVKLLGARRTTLAPGALASGLGPTLPGPCLS